MAGTVYAHGRTGAADCQAVGYIDARSREDAIDGEVNPIRPRRSVRCLDCLSIRSWRKGEQI
ncbi:MAG TPA: hypothetical protein VKB09_03305, partial [Thermomicrobiales bacterium]|nr:hypothetical protein [Thermomicrobiales bacterium]